MNLRWLPLVMLVGCRSTAEVRRDPTPFVDAPPHPPPTTTRVPLHGRIVDLATGAVPFPLRATPPRIETSDDLEAFIVDTDDVLRVYDLANGKLRWSVVTHATRVAVDRHHVYLTEGRRLTVVDRRTHVSKRWLTAASDIDELHVLGDRLLVQDDASGLSMFEGASGKLIATEPTPSGLATTMDQREGSIATSDQGFCFVAFEKPNHVVHCLDLSLRSRSRTVVDLAKPTDPPMTRTALRVIGRAHVVIGTWSTPGTSPARRSAVVRLDDGLELVRVEDEVSALAERADGELEGLLVVGSDLRMLSPSGMLRWHVPAPKHAGQFVRGLLHGDRMVIAHFDELTRNVHVTCLAFADGRTLWTHEIALAAAIPGTHPASIDLDLRGDAVVVHSHEPSRDRVRVFDVSTGATRFADPEK